MSEKILEAKFDGGRFADARWYVDGYSDHWFTTKADADAAIKLAYSVASDAERELGNKIRDMLP